jgi:paraquat-inducible protein A
MTGESVHHLDSEAGSLHACLSVCHECDLLNQVPALPPDRAARCSRCGHVLFRNPANCVEKTLALSFSALILWIVANVFPFLSFGLPGNLIETNLVSGVVSLYEQNQVILAIVVLTTSIIAPALQIAGLIYILAPLNRGRRLPASKQVMRWLGHIKPWSMMEVFMLGILVSMVKLGGMADVVPGIALWAFCCLIVVLSWALSTLEPHVIWEQLDRAEETGAAT